MSCYKFEYTDMSIYYDLFDTNGFIKKKKKIGKNERTNGMVPPYFWNFAFDFCRMRLKIRFHFTELQYLSIHFFSLSFLIIFFPFVLGFDEKFQFEPPSSLSCLYSYKIFMFSYLAHSNTPIVMVLLSSNLLCFSLCFTDYYCMCFSWKLYLWVDWVFLGAILFSLSFSLCVFVFACLFPVLACWTMRITV